MATKNFLSSFDRAFNLFSKFCNTLFVSCFVFEIFRTETVRLSAILDLILPHQHEVQQG